MGLEDERCHGPEDTRLNPEPVTARHDPEPGSREDNPRAHLNRIMASFNFEAPRKYLDGQAVHGGVLSRKPGLIRHAKEEALDQYIYLVSLQEQATRVTSLVAHGILNKDWRSIQRAYNLLLAGNDDGLPE